MIQDRENMDDAMDIYIPINQMTLVDWLDDLTVRFLLNLPPAELSSVPRLCFQVEEAQWFYEDFIRPANPNLPSLNLKQFCLTLFQHCPLLSDFDTAQHLAAYEEFLAYKVRVPVRGAILMDQTMEKALLVRGWKKGASWSFPRGKINKDEPDLDCAIREVYEETGYDIAAAGLVATNQEDGHVKAIDITMREQHMKLFVFRGVPLDTYFEPRTRKEISKIQWYNVKDLPGFKKLKGQVDHGQGELQASKFYMVAPFLGHLKKWIGQQRKKDAAMAEAQARHGRNLSVEDNGYPSGVTEDEVDTEVELAPERVLTTATKSGDELKRMLSIGGLANDGRNVYPIQSSDQGHTNHLLALLQSKPNHAATNSIPQTPLEQIDPPIPQQQPSTPQPHHPRQPIENFPQQHAPWGPFPSAQYQNQQSHAGPHPSISSPHIFNSTSGDPAFYAPTQMFNPASLVPPVPQSQRQSQYQQQNAPVLSRAGAPTNSDSLMYLSRNQPTRPYHSDEFERQSGMETQRPRMYQPFIGDSGPLENLRPPQNSYGPAESGPRVPEASKLPPPKLTAHAMTLLDAFKGSSKISSTANKPSVGGYNPPKDKNQPQAALLNLFKPPSVVQSETERSSATVMATSSEDAAVEPLQTKLGEQRPTLDEISRSLPFDSKATSTGSTPPAVALSPPQSSIQPKQAQHAVIGMQNQRASHLPSPFSPLQMSGMSAARPRSRGKLYDPSDPQRNVQSTSQTQRLEQEIPPFSANFIRQSPSGQVNGSPKPSPHRKSNSPVEQTDMPTPRVSILQRPGSSNGKSLRSPMPETQQRNESSKSTFQPQVLKRPTSGNADGDNAKVQSSASLQSGDGKKDQLLALFGKMKPSTPTSPPASKFGPSLDHLNNEQQNNDPRGGSIDGQALKLVTKSNPTPPPAPQLQPEREPPRPTQPSEGRQSHQQQLLNLFQKSGLGRSGSPGTPISPFTLGTPVSKHPPFMTPNTTSKDAPTETRSRLGSYASVGTNDIVTEPQITTPSSTSSTEAKGFLLDYLNGVVKKEGYRGAGRA